jgi:hypothetical protein
MICRPNHLRLTGPAGLALSQGCWGAALLLCDRPLLESLAGEPVSSAVIRVARVLGVRELLQGLITVRRPTRRVLLLGAAADALHAATMVGGTAADIGPRRLTLASAAVAGGFAASAARLS